LSWPSYCSDVIQAVQPSKRQVEKQRSAIVQFLGNFNQELTCLVFGFNTYTFTNWIFQPVYYPKWVPFVTGFTFADVVNAIPQQHREKYVSVLLGSQVQLQP
jgi:hypothetical protein